jgi:formylglycine-generating enzyme required for sulfatase activity
MTTDHGPADVFISHAYEDKEVARPLAEALRQRGLTVWYDEYVLRLGDSLREVIERGLASSRFGVVILSPSFFAKEWPQRELNALLARETTKRSKVLLPVWHNLTLEEVTARTPILADRLAVSTAKGIPFIVEQILAVLEAEKARSAAAVSPPAPPPPIRKAEPFRSAQAIPEKAAARPNQKGTLSVLWQVKVVALWMSIFSMVVIYWYSCDSFVAPRRPKNTMVTSTGTSTQPAPQTLKACSPREEPPTKDGIVFVRICPGTFTMGSAEDDPQAGADEKPAHQVTLRQFWLGKTEITNEQYRRFRPDHQGEARLPVTGVTWFEAKAACAAFGGRLPTEAEWEYAARAGSQTTWSFGADEKRLGEYAWYGEEWAAPPHLVGTKRANIWGLYDMYGNALEWVADWYGFYTSAAQIDPSGPAEGEVRMLRGGSSFNTPRILHSATRYQNKPQNRISLFGFRCARDARSRP